MLTSFLELKDDAPATDICKALHKMLESEIELRKQNGQSTSLPEDNPHQEWIKVCEKADATVEDLVAIFKKVIDRGEAKQ